jgi:hypothetical protein
MAYSEYKSPIFQLSVTMVILTCLAALMKLLDDTGVTSFETDTTFKQVAGEMNEWEVVLVLKSLQRGESFYCRHSSMVISMLIPDNSQLLLLTNLQEVL